MKLMLISDIHANLTALDAVIGHAKNNYYNNIWVAHIGDAIDYGMRPNETLERLDSLKSRMIINLIGNHERATLGLDMERFSSSRGVEACLYTRNVLDKKWFDYINSSMAADPQDIKISGKRVLFIHGTLADPFWGEMIQTEMKREVYRDFDYVICGHTHIPFFKEEFFLVDASKGRLGKSKTTFINPGSIGQPRNHNPASQYAVLDFETGSVHFNAVPYDFREEILQNKGEIDNFYSDRLELGI
jgi:putative phosphoesterase